MFRIILLILISTAELNSQVNENPSPKRCKSYLGNSTWIPIQRRMDGSVDFYRNWTYYQKGFGNGEGEFWLGNDKLYELTSTNKYKLLVVLEDFDNVTRCALYNSFSVGSPETNYKLTIGGYSGDAGDSLYAQNNMQFTTYDADHDLLGTNCAVLFQGAWWYADCHLSNLNGRYLKGYHVSFANGVNWRTFKDLHYSLKFTEMKIAPV